MREILFRGKRVDNGEWIEGDLYHILCSKIEYLIAPIDELGVDVIPKTINQYTGLTDKNGTKIFEGDIVKCVDKNSNKEFTAVVEFGNPNAFYSWGWQLNYINGAKLNLDILLWVEMEEIGVFIEVIGNIFDNHELL